MLLFFIQLFLPAALVPSLSDEPIIIHIELKKHQRRSDSFKGTVVLFLGGLKVVWLIRPELEEEQLGVCLFFGNPPSDLQFTF